MKDSNLKFYTVSLFLFIIFIFLIYHFTGIFPEEHTECEFSVHHNGIFLNAPTALFNNWSIFTFITYPIVLLKNVLPDINIHGCLMLLLTCIYFSNYIFILTSFLNNNKNAGNKNNNVFHILLALLLVSIMISELFFIQYIKISIHLLFSGIILYNIFKSISIRIIGFTCAIIGIMLRYEAFMIVFPLLLLSDLLFYKNYKKAVFFIRIKMNLVFATVTFICIIFCYQNITKSDKAYYPYHAIVNTIADFRYQETDPTKKTSLELAKLKMIQNYYYNDVEHLNVKEIYALGIKPMERNPFKLIYVFDLSYSLKRGFHDFINFTMNNYKYLIIYLICYLLVLFIVIPNQIWKSILLLLSSLIFLLMMAIYMDLQDRFGIPVLTFAFIFNLQFCLRNSAKTTRSIIIILSVMVFISTTLNTYNTYFKVKQFLEIDTQSILIQKTLSNKKNIDVVFWDFYLWNVLNNRVASNYPLYNKNRDYSIDFPFGFALDEYKDRMQQKFNNWKLNDIITQSIANKRMVYFTSEDNINTIINYVNLQYNRHVVINKKNKTPLYTNKLCSPNIKYYLFYLSED